MMGGSVLLCLGGVVILVCLTEHPSRVGEESFFYNSLTPSLLYILSLPLFPPHTPSSLSLLCICILSLWSITMYAHIAWVQNCFRIAQCFLYSGMAPPKEDVEDTSTESTRRKTTIQGLECRKQQGSSFCLPSYFLSLSIHMSLLPFSSFFPSHYHHFPLQMAVVRKQNRYCREQGSLLIVKVTQVME